MANGPVNHNRGLIRVVPPAQLESQLAAQDKEYADAKQAADQPTQMENDLAGYIRTQWEQMRRHRNSSSGWSTRLIEALRAFNGEYSPDKLAEIQKFGGSEIYARIIAMKCRGSSSLLRDVYLTSDRPWSIDPPADPDVPAGIVEKIGQLINLEVEGIAQGGGQPPDPAMIRDRFAQLMEAARGAETKAARKRAKLAQKKIDELLEAGGFYKALAEFIVDLPLFPFACIKGPTVKIMPTVKWENGRPVSKTEPRMVWSRVSPFDLWFTPGVADIEDACVVERSRVTRADLNDLLDIPGYNAAQIRAALAAYGSSGLVETTDGNESERAVYENRESPQQNTSSMIDMLTYTGNIQGLHLLRYGMNPADIPDPVRDYMVEAFIVGRYVIKVQLSPSPRKRHAYYITSFEKVPGTPIGNALPDILADIAEASNASLRNLLNNMAISSGPQVVIRDDMTTAGQNSDDLYPWKRWHVQGDMIGASGQQLKPVDFFQPQSNAQELLAIYQRFGEIADELSAIPRHMSGANPGSGAGRTASGLAMLMGNASKILQTVAANIDRDVMDPLLLNLYDMIMLTDETGILNGDENIRVMGVNVAQQRETQRQRQLEFLQITANPMDTQIIGIQGRAKILRSISSEIGLDGEGIVPPDDQLAASIQQAQQSGVTTPPQPGGGGAPAPQAPQTPRTNVTQ